MIRSLYSFLLYLLAPLIVTYLYLIRGKKNPAYRAHFRERFALNIKHLPKNAAIFHCASVGEVLAATPLINAYQKKHNNLPVIITCNTPTGRQQVINNFDTSVHVCYLPLDFWDCTKRFISSLSPKLLVILETELWPNLLVSAQKHHCPTVILNARLSNKSLKGYRRVQPLTKLILDNISHLASHNNEDAERFISLGLANDKITVTGSIKFDIQVNPLIQQQSIELKTHFIQRPTWVAGSTHPQEHEQVLSAHKQLLEHYPNALLIIAPRHPEQFEPVANLITQTNLTFTRRSEGASPNKQVLLADTLGELKMLYGTADVAYIGGSLIPRGGHNPLEAAAFSVSILTGPSTYNFSHIYPELLAANGALTVSNQYMLANALADLMSQPDKRTAIGNNAHACLKKNQGAIDKSINLLTIIHQESK